MLDENEEEELLYGDGDTVIVSVKVYDEVEAERLGLNQL
jgi:hypothetical protein